MKPSGFPKEYRLRKRPEYLALSQGGKRIQNSFFIAVFAPARGQCSRVGVTVTKRVGNAVMRNRIKRQVREFFRCNRSRLPAPCDINFIAKQRCTAQDKAGMGPALDQLLNQIAKSEEARHN